MKRLVYNKPHSLSKIGTELIQAFPAWIKTLPDGSREANCSITGDGQTLTLWVPDDQDEAAVAAVVAAHDPTPLPRPDPDKFREALIGALDGIDMTAKFQRAKSLRQKFPGFTEPFLGTIEGTDSPGKAHWRRALWADAVARVGTANEIITATERDAIRLLATQHHISL